MIVDPRIVDLIRVEEDADNEYRLSRVWWRDVEESAGMHHILIDVLDENGNRAVGTVVTVFWDGGSADTIIEAKPGEEYGGNFPMYATLGSYNVRVGASSDVIYGLGLGTPSEPGVKYHTCFELTFRRGGAEPPGPPEPPEPPAPPEPPEPPAGLIEHLQAVIAHADEAKAHAVAALALVEEA
jgi:hypothetical protein